LQMTACKNRIVTVKILIADAGNEVKENVSPIVREYLPDCELVMADSGEQCLEILKNDECLDAVILSSDVSDMTCFKLIEAIRDDSDIPIIVISDDEDIQMLVRAFESGANDYIPSTFNGAIFIAQLKALIRRREWDMQAGRSKPREVRGVG